MAEVWQQASCAGVSVRVQADAPAAALRYFARDGAFAAAARAAGAPLPDLQRAHAGAGELLLAWRSPSETLCLAPSAQRLEQLRAALGVSADGCIVELSGALSVVHLRGGRIAELIERIGGSASLPAPGEARRSRMADVPVLALCLEAQELRLVIERGLAEHLMGWITETLLDFA